MKIFDAIKKSKKKLQKFSKTSNFLHSIRKKILPGNQYSLQKSSANHDSISIQHNCK